METLSHTLCLINWEELPAQSLLAQSDMLPLFKKSISNVLLRSLSDSQNIVTTINNKEYQIAQPITFTPYASSMPCSARCWFCSENLRHRHGMATSMLRIPSDYQAYLTQALSALSHIPLGLSLSGLEITDDPEWLISTLNTLEQWQQNGGQWTEKAAYSNAAGFANPSQRTLLTSIFEQFGINRLEISRHHDHEKTNQDIMRFHTHHDVQLNACFEQTIKYLSHRLPVTLVCIIQENGISSLQDILRYQHWAFGLGVHKVIFRELCQINDKNYKKNKTLNLINLKRKPLEHLLVDLYQRPPQQWELKNIIAGYYFWNSSWRTPLGLITFEKSDYQMMQQHHQQDTLYKLVFHANGNLCSDWSADQQVILRTML